jgi:hypothetical protein
MPTIMNQKIKEIELHYGNVYSNGLISKVNICKVKWLPNFLNYRLDYLKTFELNKIKDLSFLREYPFDEDNIYAFCPTYKKKIPSLPPTPTSKVVFLFKVSGANVIKVEIDKQRLYQNIASKLSKSTYITD